MGKQKKKVIKEKYHGALVNSQSTVMVQGVRGWYLPKGWTRAIQVKNPPCLFDLYLDGRKVATSSEDGRIDFEHDITTELRRSLETPLIQKAMPPKQRAQVVNMYRVPQAELVFHAPPADPEITVITYWYLMVTPDLKPLHNHMFNQNFPEGLEEKRKVFRNTMEQSAHKLPIFTLKVIA
jgi:hypothetical protein